MICKVLYSFETVILIVVNSLIIAKKGTQKHTWTGTSKFVFMYSKDYMQILGYIVSLS